MLESISQLDDRAMARMNAMDALTDTDRVMSRRELLRRGGGGFAALALAGLLARNRGPAPSIPRNPLAPRPPHFPARAKRVIFLFMHGGPSQVDTFDHKPLLDRDHGKPLPFAKPRVVSSQTGNLLRSPFKFRQHGQSGIAVSELFPHLAGCVDDLCMINSMHGSNSRHGGALLELHTGSDTFVRPSMGSWITYGLGTENQDLPGFITICPNLSHGGVNNWSSAFLPAVYQGTPIGNAGVGSDQAKIPFITNRTTLADAAAARARPDPGDEPRHLEQAGADRRWKAGSRRSSWPSACRPRPRRSRTSRANRPRRSGSTGSTRHACRDFGRQCLMARRFAERGVRFVQVSHSYKWDQHSGLKKDVARNALEVDRPIAGLLNDLKARGLLDDTLVLWGGEFGRTPTSAGGRRPRPQPPRLHDVAGRRRVKPGYRPRQDRRLRLLRRRGQGPRPRPARDDPPPARPRPHQADLPLRRPRLPPDRRLRRSRPGNPRLN